MSKVIEGISYTKEHEWVRFEGDLAVIGITDHAQKELGDIVYIELPKINKSYNEGESVGTIEAVKTVADIYNPMEGVILEINTQLEHNADMVNTDPYGDGWIYKIKINVDPTDLMTAEQYRKLIS